MTIKKMMRLTLEQEQLIYKIAAQLRASDLLQFYYWQQAYECELCNGDPVGMRSNFKHASDCPLTLADQLLDTLQEK